jgi:hypothetical protein
LIEKKGIPTVAVGIEYFAESARDAKKREGVPIRTVTIPYNYFGETRERIYSEVKDAISSIMEALSRPLDEEERRTDLIEPPKLPRIALNGAFEEIQDYFHTFQWSDGLPIIPPTEDKVEEMIKGTRHPRDEVIGLLRPEFLQVTVEKVAINAVMAGCKPEYLPVILAIVEGYVKHETENWIVSTTSVVNFHLVNGPIRDQIGMNRGIGAQGPGNQANACIGRAATLCNINLGGWWPGRNSLGTQGHPAQYICCAPENEEMSPWEPFHVEKGYHKGDNIVSIFIEFGGFYGSCEGMRPTMPKSLSNIQRPFKATVLLDPSLADIISREGYSKQDLKKWLWENTTETFDEWWRDPFLPNAFEKYIGEPGYWPENYRRGSMRPDEIVPKFPSPESIDLIVIGGGAKPLYQVGGMKYRCSESIDKWK